MFVFSVVEKNVSIVIGSAIVVDTDACYPNRSKSHNRIDEFHTCFKTYNIVQHNTITDPEVTFILKTFMTVNHV